ncbi:unnamed protein product [Urochloa decumbens]|uniref:Uncharacterized protein n=1 Tax=Urochloa decumbens TaxID=240449 RepID=A0ABC8X7J6_9POAL
MQGSIARASLCPYPKARRATFGCPVARARHVPRRSLSAAAGSGGKWCVPAAAGKRARERDVPTGLAGALPAAEGRHAAAAPPSGARRGSVAGAVALIVGTSIGSGILAVPQSTAPAGFIPSAACMVTCWAFLVAEALLIAEINVHLRRRRNKDGVSSHGGGDAGRVGRARGHRRLPVPVLHVHGGLRVQRTPKQVPAALPVIIFTLVFHDIAPVICAYLEGDLARIRLSILVGSLVPLVSLLVWDDIALGLATDLGGFDIRDMLKTDWSYTVVQTFSLLAVGTSLIGTLLGASQFFIEQMTNLASSSAKEHVKIKGKINKGISVFSKEDGSGHPGAVPILEENRVSYIATGTWLSRPLSSQLLSRIHSP